MTSQLSVHEKADTGALYQVIREVRRLFHRLANATDRLHADIGVTTAQRAILEALADAGRQAVPELARMKGVTRQHVQVIANDLVAAGLVTARPNPAHRTSVLLELSDRGRHTFTTMRSREEKLLGTVVGRLDVTHLKLVAKTLNDLGEAVDERLGQASPHTRIAQGARS